MKIHNELHFRNSPSYRAKEVQEWFEEQNNKSEVLTWLKFPRSHSNRA